MFRLLAKSLKLSLVAGHIILTRRCLLVPVSAYCFRLGSLAWVLSFKRIVLLL